MSDSRRDEDTLTIPDEWRELIHPRRGGVSPLPAAEADPSALTRVRERVEAVRSGIERSLADERRDNRTELQAARAYLRGEPDPLGAAVVSEVEVRLGRDRQKERARLPWIDAWVAEHGLAFAACACAEGAAVSGEGVTVVDGVRCRVRGRRQDTHAYFLTIGAARRMRSLLAVASDAEYAEAVERLSAHREFRLSKIMASYLVPTRHDWAKECLSLDPLDVVESRILWCVATTARQVARLGDLTEFAYYPDDIGHLLPGILATAVEGVGPDIAPTLVRCLDRAGDAGYRKAYLDALAVLPGDEAFRALAGRLEAADVQPAVAAMTRRFPRRALRILAPVAAEPSEAGRVALSLLEDLLRTRPDLPAGGLPDTVRSAVETLREGMVPEAAPGDLPKALRSGRAPEPPPWAAPAMLPQLLLRGRDRAVPADAAARLVAGLAKTGPRRAPSAAVREALDACDPVSLAEYGWALFDRWRTSGAARDNGWPLAQLRWTGDDSTARRIGTMVRAAAWADGVRLPQNALAVLAAMQTDVAMMQLASVAENAKPKAVKRRARKLLDQVARERGLTPDQLADRLVPDFGLDPGGTLTLDYGPRRFTVGFDEQLRPQVFDEKGKPRKTLPKPGAKDDPVLAPAAHKRFTGLKKDVRTLAAAQIRRLERAMVERRRWDVRDFRELLVDHPLMWHVVRRLVWLHEDGDAGGGKATAFRVAEDRTFADADDDVLTLPDSGRVGVAHPVLLGDDLDAWAAVFADYEIVQPFPQLGRGVYALTPQERDAARLDRFAGREAGAGAVLGLERRGWVRLGSSDGGAQPWLTWTIPDLRRTITIEISPGVIAWNPGVTGTQTLESVTIAVASGGGGAGEEASFGDLDPVSASELLLTLTTLVDSAP